jgi:hypothetical protein
MDASPSELNILNFEASVYTNEQIASLLSFSVRRIWPNLESACRNLEDGIRPEHSTGRPSLSRMPVNPGDLRTVGLLISGPKVSTGGAIEKRCNSGGACVPPLKGMVHGSRLRTTHQKGA